MKVRDWLKQKNAPDYNLDAVFGWFRKNKSLELADIKKMIDNGIESIRKDAEKS